MFIVSLFSGIPSDVGDGGYVIFNLRFLHERERIAIHQHRGWLPSVESCTEIVPDILNDYTNQLT